MRRNSAIRNPRSAIGRAPVAACSCLVLFLAACPAFAQEGPRPVLETTVAGVAPDRGVVALSAGSRDGVEVGDQFWVFNEGRIDASGRIQFVSPGGSAGTAEGAAEVKTGQAATILRSAALSSYRDGLPPEMTIRGQIARVAPARGTAWLDLGARSGLKTGDRILIRRMAQGHLEVPLARGRVETVRDQTALVVLEPLVGNTLPQPEDTAELWPSPADRRMGRVESMVLATQPASEAGGDLSLTLVGSADDGIEKGRLVDLFRGRQYIGHATIVEVGDRNSTAIMFNAGRRQRAAEGDRAWIRPPPGPPARPLRAAIFQIISTPTGDVAQIAAGETDGVTEGEKFVVRHTDPGDPTIRTEVAELTIQHVQNDFSTASIPPHQRQNVRLWDFAERRSPALPDWREIGMITRVMPESSSAVADVEERSTATVGRIVRCMPEEPAAPDAVRRPAAAIVINRHGLEATLYVPPGWGNVQELVNARVGLADDSGKGQ